MNIIFLSHRHTRSGGVRMGNLGAWGLLLVFVFALPTTAFYAGMRVSEVRATKNPKPTARPVDVATLHATRAELERQRQSLSRVRRELHSNLSYLSVELAKLEGQAIRLDALGQRLVDIAGLQSGEFNFSRSPAQGGPEGDNDPLFPDVSELANALNHLALKLDSSEQQLDVLSRMWLDRRLSEETLPAGRPVKGGWISSVFGRRTDPFTGKRSMHTGIDFAVPAGSPVEAVAAGLVSFSGWRKGYGRVVELVHSNGMKTVYAHNKANLVNVGQRVRKHQTIALVGSSGRSTGPHLHYEVIKDGKHVNPSKYLAQR